MRNTMLLLALSLVAVATSAGGCASGPPADLKANDPTVRIPAIKRAVRTHDMGSARAMVKDLRSDDPAIRLYAVQGLRRLTGQDMGYRYYADEPERLPATKKWEAWLQEQEQSTPEP